MAAYLVEHPPKRRQYRKGRRAKPTGTLVLHTAENAPDLRPPDLGAENIASFIRGRSDPGSYHTINDQDSTLRLVPFEWEAFGDGTGSNAWAIHLSIAMRADQWWNLNDQQKLWYMAGLATAAREASDWLTATHGITVPTRRLTKASYNQPGFCSHQDRETWFGTKGRRTDPWRNDEALWHLFLTLYDDTDSQEEPVTEAEIDRIANEVTDRVVLHLSKLGMDLIKRLDAEHEHNDLLRDSLADLIRDTHAEQA